MPSIGLRFLRNDGGEAEGLADSGIETFRDAPFAAVARETGQNSRDARLRDDMPVVVRFDEMDIDAAALPSIEQFRDAAERCLTKARSMGGEKEVGFFERASRALSAQRIKILRVADFNTTGVRGPCIEGRPFHTLAKSDGSSVKPESSAGGSFGIGKNAAFAVSEIQTVFVSTQYVEEGEDVNLCMGKTLFMSHEGPRGEQRRRKGYWGVTEGFLPVDRLEQIPHWLRRESQGTSVFSICVRSESADWRYEVAAELIMNFFAAVHRGEMQFRVDGDGIVIDDSTLALLFRDPAVLKAVEELSAAERFRTARELYSCLVDPEAVDSVLNVPELGDIRIRVLMREGVGYSVGIVRNGMFITDNLKNFDEPFSRFPMYREFAAIVEPAGKDESAWFRRVENPSHDALSAERIHDPQLREQGRRAFRRMAKLIRSHLKSEARGEPSRRIALEELNEFFVSEKTLDRDLMGTLTVPGVVASSEGREMPSKRETKIQVAAGEESVQGLKYVGSGKGADGRPNRDGGRRLKHSETGTSVILHDVRNRIVDGDASRRRIFFTPSVTGVVALAVQAAGINNPEDLAIREASIGHPEDGRLYVQAKEGERAEIELRFGGEYAGPVLLSAALASQHGVGGE